MGFYFFYRLALIIISINSMEDIFLSSSTTTISHLHNLRARIDQIEQRDDQYYYALSIHFVINDYYIEELGSRKINYDLFEDDDPLSGRLKQGLAYKIHFVVIDQLMLDQISSLSPCSTIPVGRNPKYGQRWLIYKQRVLYHFIQSNLYEQGNQQQELQCRSIQSFPYNDTQDIRINILKAEGLPQFYCGRFSIFPDKLPKTYGKLKQTLQSKNKLIPYFILIHPPEIFKLKRKYKNYVILIEPEVDMILPDLQVRCQSHGRLTQCGCICQHSKSFACDKDCYQGITKHNRCIYTKNKYSDCQEDKELFKVLKRKKYMGLYNENNMCFFNTIVQCLTHIKLLSQYFLNFSEEKELNYWNIDGTYGEVANQYARFIRSYFTNGNQNCNMALFYTVGRWHPPYANKNQQDSHEFLIKILDWLKEDLNLNQRKPAYKNIETNNKSQEQILRSTTGILKARNNSTIQSLMQGLQKSVIKCLQCNSKSSTFDSFLTVQLAMSGQKREQISSKSCFVYYIFLMNSQRIKKLRLAYYKDDTIYQLKKQVASFVNRSKGFQLDFYRVNQAGKVEKLNQFNMIDLLNIQDQKKEIIYCVQKYFTNSKGQNVQVKLVFTGTESLPFSRPFFINKEIQVQPLYSKILSYIFICRKQELVKNNPQGFLNSKFQQDLFPFDLIIKSRGQETLVHRVKSYKKYFFEENDTLIVRIRNNPSFAFQRLNICSPCSKQQPVVRKRTTIVQSSLEDCLKLYCKKQMIEEGMWTCPTCQTKRNAAKTLYFHQLPRILILSINRFKEMYSSQNSYFRKNEGLVRYEEYLNMGKFTQSQQDQMYRLYAVAIHVRLDSTLRDVRDMDGHYYAYIRLEDGWKKFDDSTVSQVLEDKVYSNKNAYILFYEKV